VENNVQKKYVIVEAESDKHILLGLLRYMAQTEGVEVSDSDFDWEHRSADPSIEIPSGLVQSITPAIKEVPSKMHKIAIVWDMDTLTEAQRIQQCNTAIQMAIKNIRDKNPDYVIEFVNPLTVAGQFTALSVNGVSVEIGAYFINHNGKGEMEDLLKAIKTQPSPIADCVDALLPDCLAQHDENPVKDKDLIKLWMNHYIRYDTLPSNKRSDKFTKWENVMLKRSDIFDFNKTDVSALAELKSFLIKLCS
jgi:hypothetical protein